MKVYRFGELLAAVANLLCIAKASSSNRDERSRTDPNAQEAQSLLLLNTFLEGECSRHKNIGSTQPSEPIPEEPTIMLTTLDEKMLECIGNIHMYFDKYLVWVALAVGIRTDPYHNLNGINEETVRDMVKLLVKLKTTIEKINLRGNGQTVNEDPNIFYVIFQNIDKELAKKDYEEVCNRISSRIIDNGNIIKILSCFNTVIAYLSVMSGLCREMHEKCNGKLTDQKCDKPSISVKLLELIEKCRNDELCKEICKTDNIVKVCCQKTCGDEEQRKNKNSSVNLGLDINIDIRDLINRLHISLTDGLSTTNSGPWVDKDKKQQTKCGDCNSNTTKPEEKTLIEPSSSQSKAITEIMLELLAKIVVEKRTEDSEVKTHEVASKCHDVKDQDDAMLKHISKMFNGHIQSIHNLMEVYKTVKGGGNSKVNSFDNPVLKNSEKTSTRTQSDLSDKIIELLKIYFDTNAAGKNGSNAEDGKKVK